MNSSIIAITGATGYVGRFVVDELQRQNYQIRALCRPTSNRNGFLKPIEWIEGNLKDTDALNVLTHNADAVVHLAYEHVEGKYRGGEGNDLDAWLDANLIGSLELLKMARNESVERFIFLSSRAVFSRTVNDRELDEAHPISPITHYGSYKAAIEAMMKSFAHIEGMKTYSIRSTGVYGKTFPVERSKWWGLIQAVLDNNADVLQKNRDGTEVYGGDVARLVARLLKENEIMTDTIHMSDLYTTYAEIIKIIRDITKIKGVVPEPLDTTPQNILVSHRLENYDIELGGRDQLISTLRDLTTIAQDQQ